MGALGDSIKTTVDSIVDNVNFRTSITVTPRTPALDSYGGYGDITDNEGSPSSVYGVPYDQVEPDLIPHDSGDLKTGEVKIIFKSGTNIVTTDKVTFNTIDWDVRLVEPILFNDVEVATIVTLSPRLDSINS
jgi:hypothetical protein